MIGNLLATTKIAASTEAAANSIQPSNGLWEAIALAKAGDFSALISVGMTIAVPAVLALMGLFVSYLVARLISHWVAGPVCKRVDETLGKFAAKFIFYGIMVCATVGIASTVGLNVTSFAAVMAAAGFAIGMAFQGTLANFAAGILLMVFRPFKVGDVINVAGVIGKVNEIDLFTITVDTPDNRRIIIPNGAVAGNTIENVTYHPHRRVEVRLGVSYAANIQATRQALTSAADSLAELMVRGEDRGYLVILDSLGASSVDWLVRFWTPSSKFFEAKEKLTIAIKEQLDASGISIPFPQMDVHIDGLPMTLEVPSGDSETPTRTRPRLRHRA